MRILILGGGNNQLNAIKMAAKKGHEVVLTDYYPDAPGRKYAKYNEVVSTFDVDGNLRVAKKYDIDGVMTVGTDQPIYTAACVANEMKLPSFLDVETAEAVTNKKKMKSILSSNHIPTASYKLIASDFSDDSIKELGFPAVLKPIDSQGQRGVFKVNSIKEVRENILETLSCSRCEEALLEEYYESDEITVSCWIQNGLLTILTVTDRETFQRGKHIGICFAHTFPSKYHQRYEKNISALMQDIRSAFKLQNGPLYVQLLAGLNGILVNEIACRIGGAYEDLFIPHVTGFDILGQVIDFTAGEPFSPTEVIHFPKGKMLSVQLFFALPGIVDFLTPIEEISRLPGMIKAGYNISSGDEIKMIRDATARAGFMIIEGDDRKHLNQRVSRAFKKLKILDDKNHNLAIRIKNELRGDK
ncbi:MAG: ATP-grasp domain-containing protein [Eubacteriaceae bacterium]|nr:ATP-grasp domain-containing protein [Eubacteriaceae bacterium]